MEKFLAISCLLIIAASYASSEHIKTEDGVLVLTNANFKEAIKNNKFVFVNFYSPWCRYCKELAPEYAKAAKILAEEKSPIKLAQVDATVEGELSEEQKVRAYPTLKFFHDGVATEYRGARQAAEIVSWVNKQAGRN